jgi:eukaryotic-like serine/threonine-protein kinase
VTAAGDVGAWRVTGVLGVGACSRVYAVTRVGRCPRCDVCPTEVALKVVRTATLPPALRELCAALPSDPPAQPGLLRTFHRFADRRHELVLSVLERATGSVAGALARGGVPAGPVLRDVARAVRALHRAGWLHGNLTAGNVLLMADGSARLGDLDLARPMVDGVAWVPPFGSLDYLPPECWSARLDERGWRAGPALDLWAFGVLAHRMVTGRHPFPADRPHRRIAAVRRYGQGRVPGPVSAHLPEPWGRLIATCLRADPAERDSDVLDEVTRLA